MNSSHLSNLQEQTLQAQNNSLPQKIQAILVYSQHNKGNTKFAPFEKHTLVKAKNSFGIVLKNSYDQYNRRFITIAWWKNNSTEIERKFSYPYEDLKPLSITPLDQLIPQKTIVLIPKGTTILINNDINILQKSLFFLKEIDSQGSYHLVNPESSYIFSYSNFPGVPFACLVEFPTLKELAAAANHLDKLQLRILAGAWLINNQPPLLADYLKENTDAFLKSVFIKSSSLIEKTWLDEDFNSAWNQAISDYLTLSLKTEGLQGYKIHERLVHRFNRPSEFATLININLTLDQPY